MTAPNQPNHVEETAALPSDVLSTDRYTIAEWLEILRQQFAPMTWWHAIIGYQMLHGFVLVAMDPQWDAPLAPGAHSAARAIQEAVVLKRGCLGRCEATEPVFVLVARDVTAVARVRDWVTGVEAAYRAKGLSFAEIPQATRAKLTEAMHCADAMDAWRETHGGGKIPD